MHTIESETTVTVVRLPEIRVGHVTLPVYRGNDGNLYTELEKLLQGFSQHPSEQASALITHPLLGEGLVIGFLEGDNDDHQPIVLMRADMLAMFLANLNLKNMKTDGAYEVVKSIQWEAAQVLAEAFVSGRLTDAVKTNYQVSQQQQPIVQAVKWP